MQKSLTRKRVKLLCRPGYQQSGPPKLYQNKQNHQTCITKTCITTNKFMRVIHLEQSCHKNKSCFLITNSTVHVYFLFFLKIWSKIQKCCKEIYNFTCSFTNLTQNHLIFNLNSLFESDEKLPKISLLSLFNKIKPKTNWQTGDKKTSLIIEID